MSRFYGDKEEKEEVEVLFIYIFIYIFFYSVTHKLGETILRQIPTVIKGPNIHAT